MTYHVPNHLISSNSSLIHNQVNFFFFIMLYILSDLVSNFNYLLDGEEKMLN